MTDKIGPVEAKAEAGKPWGGQWKCGKCARILDKSDRGHYGYPLGPDHVPYELCDGETRPHERRTHPAPPLAARVQGCGKRWNGRLT